MFLFPMAKSSLYLIMLNQSLLVLGVVEAVSSAALMMVSVKEDYDCESVMI